MQAKSIIRKLSMAQKFAKIVTYVCSTNHRKYFLFVLKSSISFFGFGVFYLRFLTSKSLRLLYIIQYKLFLYILTLSKIFFEKRRQGISFTLFFLSQTYKKILFKHYNQIYFEYQPT